MQTNKTFTPRPITTDEKTIRDTITAWETYMETAIYCLCDFSTYLNLPDLTPETFLEFPLDDRPEKILAELMKQKGVAPDGLKAEKMIELGLVEGNVSEIVDNLRQMQIAKANANRLFKYDLSKLINEVGLFSLTPELQNLIREHYTKYTASQTENDILDSLEKFIAVLNEFAKFGLVKPTLGRNGLNPLLNLINASEDRKSFRVILNGFKFLRHRVDTR